MPSSSSRPPPVVALLSASLVVYAAFGLAVRGSWISALAAAVVAGLLYYHHPRARFAAYVFFSVLGARAALGEVWGLAAYALVALLLMQTPPAVRAWPRLPPGGARRRRRRHR